MTSKTIFELQFTASQIPALAGRYEARFGKDDDKAFDHAQRIVARAGAHTKESIADLLAVMRWKSQRALGHLESNTEEEIYEALDVAIDARRERTAMAVLCGLDGFGVPMASAVLTALQGYADEEVFTVIDVRALEALGLKTGNVTIGLYLEYLEYIHELKAETGYSLRMIDRGLWQWSVEREYEAAVLTASPRLSAER